MQPTSDDLELSYWPGYDGAAFDGWLFVPRRRRAGRPAEAAGPPQFLKDTDAHASAIEAILAASPTTSARSAPSLAPDVMNTWKLMAERGLFAYDSDFHGTPCACRRAGEDRRGLDHVGRLVDDAYVVGFFAVMY